MVVPVADLTDYQDSPPSRGPTSGPLGGEADHAAPKTGNLAFRNPNIYDPPISAMRNMAKNSFFIRASTNIGDTSAFAESEIDLGSYTNLGSSKPEVLRIHNVQVAITDAAGEIPTMTGDTAGSVVWQLTTQSQAANVLITDDSFVSGGRAAFRNPDSSALPPTQSWESQLLAQDFTQGYVVAVPSLFLGGLGDNNFTEDVIVSVMLECTTEPMSKANAVSLAISQQ